MQMELREAKYELQCYRKLLGPSSFHRNGYVRSQEIENLASDIRGIDTNPQHSFVKLFGELHDIEMSPCNFEKLFMRVRLRLCILNEAACASGSSNSCSDFTKLRLELREFYVFLRRLIIAESSNSNNIWFIEEVLETILKGLSVIRHQLGWLSNLPMSVINNQNNGLQCEENAAYHLFHAHLELRWLHISVIWVMSQLPLSIPEHLSHFNVNSSIRECVWDLMQMALKRFSKVRDDQVLSTSFYNCLCVKELWFLLNLVNEKSVDNGKLFWETVDQVLMAIDNGDDSFTNFKTWSSELPEKLVSSDPPLVSIWALRHLAEIFVSAGDTSEKIVASDNYNALSRILNFKGIFDLSASGNESHLRVILSLVKTLVTDIWMPKIDPVMILWDQFSRLLDCAFQPAGAPASAYAVPCDSPQNILNHVVNILESKQRGSMLTNSYDIFLSLIGCCLSYNPSQWKQKMRGRIYSKLSTKKVDGLAEIGLYHLAELFLVIALKCDDREVEERFQFLFSFKDVGDKKNEIIIKAHLSFMFLLARKSMPIQNILKSVIPFINKCIERENFDIPRLFVTTMQDFVVENCDISGHHFFIGNWINKYLQHHQPDSGKKLLTALLAIMKNLESRLRTNGGIVDEEMRLLILALWEHVLPYVLKQMEYSPSSLPIADLAVCFTFISLYLDDKSSSFGQKAFNFSNLVVQFLMLDYTALVDVRVIRRYLYLFLDKGAKHVLEEFPGVQTNIIKAWIRCSAMTSDTPNQEMNQITLKIVQQTDVIHKITKSSLSVLETSDDPVCSLMDIFGKTIKETGDTFLYCKEISRILQPLEILAILFKNHLFSPKIEKKNELSGDLIKRGYYMLGKVILNCGNVISYKGITKPLLPSLVTTSLLPNLVFDLNFKLPQPLNDALRKHLHLFLKGLVILEPQKNPAIKRFLGDIVKGYLPRMVLEKSLCEGLNPFVCIWDEPEYMGTAFEIIQSMCSIFLQLDKKNMHHQHYVQCSQVLFELLKRNETDELCSSTVIQNALPCMLEVIMKVDIGARAKVKESTIKIVGEMLKDYATHSTIQALVNNILVEISKKYLVNNFQHIITMTKFLKHFSAVLKYFIISLKTLIEQEKKNGVNVTSQQKFCDEIQASLR